MDFYKFSLTWKILLNTKSVTRDIKALKSMTYFMIDPFLKWEKHWDGMHMKLKLEIPYQCSIECSKECFKLNWNKNKEIYEFVLGK